VSIHFRDDESAETHEETFHYEGGINQFIEYLNNNKKAISPVIFFSGEKEGSTGPVQAEISMQYTDSYSTLEQTYCNNIRTIEGGTHLTGFRSALTRTINKYSEDNKLAKEKDRIDDVNLFSLVEEKGPAIIKSRHPRAEDVCANVDLYSGLVYDMLGIPTELYTPLFAVARCVSWCAHRMEELINNGPIIRPAYKPLFHPKKYVDLKDR
jgi:hypothetical protein